METGAERTALARHNRSHATIDRTPISIAWPARPRRGAAGSASARVTANCAPAAFVQDASRSTHRRERAGACARACACVHARACVRVRACACVRVRACACVRVRACACGRAPLAPSTRPCASAESPHAAYARAPEAPRMRAVYRRARRTLLPRRSDETRQLR
eukprot:6211729-Pleurochrysis_carterae.AAC.1